MTMSVNANLLSTFFRFGSGRKTAMESTNSIRVAVPNSKHNDPKRR